MRQTVEQLKEKLAEHALIGQKFGTFTGVFTPTLLTIMGVIMYLREGWVVGNAGLLGAWLIILLACFITACTGLAMSSITTNIRIGAGGAFSIISQSLGLEVGGSVGIPLYLAQALAAAMYIFGFREGWLWIFPKHPAIVVDLGVFIALFAVALTSAKLAFQIQFFIMAIIAGSLGSVIGAVAQGSMKHAPEWWGRFPGSLDGHLGGIGFWAVFAVFFPAATDIMSGANMSGELKDPRRSIPIGTMSAIALSTAVYLVLAYWLARSATTTELLNNYTILIDRSAWRPIVIAGLLGATFSSSLSSFVGAPRILYALGEHGILPGSDWFARQNRKGEPANATLVTGGIILGALLLRDLNVIAPLITLFFLITYAMINVVVLIEQNLGLVSFRPTLRIPRFVPFIGAVGCLFVMFIESPTFSLFAVVFVVAVYGILIRRSLHAPFGDVRSGLFTAIAEWAAKKVSDLPAARERTWQPNLVVPVESPYELRGSFRFLYSIARPKGTIKILGLTTAGEASRLENRLPFLSNTFRRQGVFATWAIVEASTFGQGVTGGMQALRGGFLRPNTVFLTLPRDPKREADLKLIIEKARENHLGVILFAAHPAAGLGLEKSINLWISDRSPGWHLELHLGNLDLCLLLTYLLRINWDAQLNFITAVHDPAEAPAGRNFLGQLVEFARIPQPVNMSVLTEEFPACVSNAPQADLNIFGLPSQLDFDSARRIVEATRASCAFVLASEEESALA